jgi:5'(3')-deoxyribonucleotidase
MRTDVKFVLGVDLDGVVADFYGGLRPIAAEWLDVPVDKLPTTVTYGLPEWKVNDAPGGYDALHKFAVTQRGLFRQLKPMPGAPAALRVLSNADIRIRIITHRLFIKYFHKDAVQQTIEWLDYHDIPYWDLCFMRDKAAVGAELYIEDTPSNVVKLRQDGHPTVVFTNSTNLQVDPPRANNWTEAVEITLADRQAWLERCESQEKALPGE